MESTFIDYNNIHETNVMRRKIYFGRYMPNVGLFISTSIFISSLIENKKDKNNIYIFVDNEDEFLESDKVYPNKIIENLRVNINIISLSNIDTIIDLCKYIESYCEYNDNDYIIFDISTMYKLETDTYCSILQYVYETLYSQLNCNIIIMDKVKRAITDFYLDPKIGQYIKESMFYKKHKRAHINDNDVYNERVFDHIIYDCYVNLFEMRDHQFHRLKRNMEVCNE